MDNADLGQMLARACRDPFASLRGKALQKYADLEQSLLFLFSILTGMTPDVAGIIFYKLTAARVRNKILDKLVRKYHGADYGTFFNSFDSFIGILSERRNNIVHWTTVCDPECTDLSQHGFTQKALVPLNTWEVMDKVIKSMGTSAPLGFMDATEKITVHDFLDFSARCHFAADLCFHFSAFLQPIQAKLGLTWGGWEKGKLIAESVLPPAQRQTWHDIFQQALVYPPPSSHPLFQRLQGCDSPPPASPGSQKTPTSSSQPQS